MAAIWGAGFLFLWAIIPDCLSFGFVEDSLLETDQCQDVCKNTYTLHTYDKTGHLNYCFRGCRLFNIIDFVNDGDGGDVNTTRDSCAFSCNEAYTDLLDAAACYTGCDAQANVFATTRAKMPKTIELDRNLSPFYPFLYVHSLYSNMIDKLSEQMSIRWSFYIQSDSGSMVVIKSEPYVAIKGSASFIEEPIDEYKTSNYLETNLAALDNSATPNLKHSQMGPQQGYDMIVNKEYSETPVDWLSCVSKKTGLPRMLLSLTIFISAVMMIWLCFTTAATAPEHHIFTKHQKLSINGDLDYLKASDGKALLTSVHPQDKIEEAGPLPIKIQVHRL